MLEVVPVLPFIANVTIGAGVLSYAGQLNITVVADRDTVPDLDTFTAAGGRWALAGSPCAGRRDAKKPPGAARRGREAGRRWLR